LAIEIIPSAQRQVVGIEEDQEHAGRAYYQTDCGLKEILAAIS